MCKEEGHVIPFLICIPFVVKILTVGQSCVYISIIPHFRHGHSFNPRYLRPSLILRSHTANLTINNAYAFYKSFDFHIKFQKLLIGILREGCDFQIVFESSPSYAGSGRWNAWGLNFMVNRRDSRGKSYVVYGTSLMCFYNILLWNLGLG